jgi:hypothetical protein
MWLDLMNISDSLELGFNRKQAQLTFESIKRSCNKSNFNNITAINREKLSLDELALFLELPISAAADYIAEQYKNKISLSINALNKLASKRNKQH